ncbi:TVP38/TMEM64 family protein [Planktothrix sp. FACHB-1355]|uniref:TVP38/TMEM64 family membrane protein n=1 Tax=Aerosakkonema funiforme FACHB-1375 TaxID=2949571 RepID=A0A926VFS4_9CYAN|nr:MULTISPECIES: TVP38/TMEM64 family protein [Oscillatoriales]MBD2182956.1 TVP38/TMEM64 family protein [Aerosakkonema funiforme FACHB-1375]MBD3560411.1 TVP38/TMEM64 family protein [Planktothrix sp. FACHB-1355]
MTNEQKKHSWIKLVVGIVAFIVADFILLKYTPVGSWLMPENLQALKQQAGVFAPLAYIVIYFLATLFAIPGTILTLSAGALFGAIWGALWTVIGATLGATGAFLVARFIGGEWVKQQFEKGDRLRELSQGIEENEFWFALSIRLAPIFPFNAVNYLLGLTPISLPVYILATAIGIVPGTFAYAWLGQGGLQAATGRPPWQLFGALAMLAVLSALPIVLKRWKAKKN